MPASEDRAISDFPIASSLTNRALALLSAPDGQGGYDSVHAELNEIGRTILETDYTQDLNTTDKSVFGGINENKSVIGYAYDEYDPTTAYSTGDLCIYNNTLYKALQATTGNLPTNTTYWEQTSIADAINKLKDDKQDELTFITLTIDGNDLSTTQIPNGTIRDIFYNLDISSKIPTGKKVKLFTVATSNPTAVIARQWISGDNKISVSLGNLTTTTITITAITIHCLCI